MQYTARALEVQRMRCYIEADITLRQRYGACARCVMRVRREGLSGGD